MEYTMGTFVQQVRCQTEVVDAPRTAECRAALTAHPKDSGLLLDLALALKSQMLYCEAAQVYSEILMRRPFDGNIHCQRGHVYLGMWEYRQAAADFEMALRLDPQDWDSLYHMGLSCYLLGDYEAAEGYYARCYAAGARAADRVAAADWYWLTLMRLGKTAAAARLLDEVSPDWDYEENEFYFRRLMVYKGLRDVEETLTYARSCESFEFCAYAYGIACYLWLALGRKDQARAVMEEIAAVPISQGQWATFAYQAAQASLKSDF